LHYLEHLMTSTDMRRIGWWSAFVLAGAAAWSLPRGEQVLDRARASYLEDAVPARKVASISAELVRGTDGVRLRVTIDARGPEVEAVPGFEGVRGGNLRTSEELDRLLRHDGLAVVTRSGGVAIPGAFAVASSAHLCSATNRAGLSGPSRSGSTIRATVPHRA
jgi:hypothetical protein